MTWRAISAWPSWWVWLCQSVSARVLCYCGDRLTLSAHAVNSSSAAPLATASTAERLHALVVTRDGRFLVTGGEKGAVVVRCTHDLTPWARYDGPGAAITVGLSNYRFARQSQPFRSSRRPGRKPGASLCTRTRLSHSPRFSPSFPWSIALV